MILARIAIVVATGIVVLAATQSATAHRSGCHRWHSCPSDTGSYVCGDTGYSNYCPRKTAPVTKQLKPRTPTVRSSVTTQPRQPAPSNTNLTEKSSVAVAQNLLALLGYSPGPADGVIGPRTRAAIKLFQVRLGLSVDGQLSTDLLVRMSEAARTTQ